MDEVNNQSPTPPAKPTLKVTPWTIQTWVTLGVGMCVLTAALYFLSSILQPLFVALFLCYLAIPLRNLFIKLHFPAFLANILVPALFIGAIFGLGWTLTYSFETIKERIPVYREQLDILMATMNNWSKHFPAFAQQFVNKTVSEIHVPVRSADLLSGLNVFAAFLGTACVIVLYMIFLLLETKTLDSRMKEAYGEKKNRSIRMVIREINEGIFSYIRLKTLISILTAAVCTLIMFLFKVDCWWLWGLLIFFGRFIPYIGSIVASIFPIVIYFLATGEFFKTLILAAILIVAQNIIDNYLEPKMAGKALNLSPLLVIISLAFWGWLWGIVGMVLAVPILLAIKICLDHIPSTHAFAQLLGERASE